MTKYKPTIVVDDRLSVSIIIALNPRLVFAYLFTSTREFTNLSTCASLISISFLYQVPLAAFLIFGTQKVSQIIILLIFVFSPVENTGKSYTMVWMSSQTETRKAHHTTSTDVIQACCTCSFPAKHYFQYIRNELRQAHPLTIGTRNRIGNALGWP